MKTHLHDIEEIRTIDKKITVEVLQSFSKEEVAIILKGTSPEVQDYLVKSIKKASMKRRVSELGPIPLKDVLELHQLLIDRINCIIDQNIEH